jgi:hypothetical protein
MNTSTDVSDEVCMAEKEGVFRTTISVPSDLKTRMDRVKEPVNWSAIACRAFQDKLAEIASRKEIKTMTEVVERLRATLRNEEGKDFSHGYELGRKWAENAASATELKRMEKFQETSKTKSKQDWDTWFWPRGTHHPWRILVGVIRNEKDVHPMTAQAFWQDIVAGSSVTSVDGDFLRGFVQGAVDLWAQVKSQL